MISGLDVGPTSLDLGEWYMLDALRALDNGWIVYVRPQLEATQPSFVVAHPMYGICVADVRDWVVGAHRQDFDGRLEQATPEHNWAPIDDMPRAQVHRSRSEIVRRFFDDCGSPTAKLGLVRAIVVLPRYRTGDARELLSVPQVGGRGEQSVEVWGGGRLKSARLAVLTGRAKPARRKVPVEGFHSMCQMLNDAGSLQLSR